MRNISSLFLIFFLLFSFSDAFAQNKEGANWMFGTKIHLDFNGVKPAVETFSFVDTIALGVATISDKNGELLFFSSGGRVATRQKVNGAYQEMPNGNLLPLMSGKNSTAEMIVQSPGDSNVYYLFFIDGIGSGAGNQPNLYYVKIDMRLNNGYGDVLPNSAVLLRRGVNYNILTALMHSNNRDTWLLVPSFSNYLTDSIASFLITPGGIMPPVVTKSTKTFDFNSRSKSSPNSEMFVVNSLSLRGPNLEIFDFNRTTGILTHKYSLPTPDTRYHFFSFAFSPDNSKLYTGTEGNENDPPKATLYQFDLQAGSASQIQQSRNVIFQSNKYFLIADMQLALDGKLYAVIDSGYVSQIACPNFYGAASSFKLNGVFLKGDKIIGGTLPTLNQTLFRNAGKLQAQAYRGTICAGDSVQLSVFGAGAEHFKWEPANGLTAPSDTLANPFVNPTVTTTYKVTGYSACSSDSAFVKVTVLPKIPGVTVTGTLQVATLTEYEYSVQNPTPGSTFNWQIRGGTIESGQGTSSIKVNWGAAGEGEVSVTEIPAAGCNGETVSLKVEILNGPEPVIYNVFTPDNDGKNDSFVIENLKWYPENELKIYNRWGVQVYKTSNYKNNWQAENVSAGVYYYFFTANRKSWKGWVEIVK